ncbi:flagellin [Thalassotalea sp. 1_MG-2023]|uniref:flagellin n=1 Tax=Thalassotalea sp. 1_MG-2023 TaxID=3062680 RepID=UPI0026E472F6|nr:flagellin [Thalassotalea sp. 1_MG-2023]MDO6425718.1 flagellin [Thalassotalea sp. 1_MG-2023]
MELSVNNTSNALSIIERTQQDREEKNEKLASGKSINSAADDAAGLQISSRLTSQVNNDQQLNVNAQDQVNLNNVQTGQLSSITESLQRANVLSIQSGNPLSDNNAIQGELDQLTEQINTLADKALGNGNFVSGLDANNPQATQQSIESALSTISNNATTLGAENSALAGQVSTYEATQVNVSAARSRIEDTDYGQTSSEQQQVNIQLQASVLNKKDEEARKGLLINQLV